MIVLAQYTLLLFGLFFIVTGFLMLFNPTSARAILRKAGSTNWINYGEITIRMIPATALIVFAEFSKFTLQFTLFGWFMLGTSFVLYFVPKQLHHSFSNKAADILQPIYFQCISPISITIGVCIIYGVI